MGGWCPWGAVLVASVLRATAAPDPAPAPSPAVVLDGYYLEEETVETSSGAAERRDVARTWIGDRQLRKEDGGTGSVTIFDDVLGRVLVLDVAARTYFELSRAVLDEMGRMSLTQLVPDDGGDPSQWLVKTGETRRIGAWQAYEVRVVDRPIPGARLSIWLTEDIAADERLRSRFSGAVLGDANPAAKLLAGLRSLRGYPVEVDLTVRLGAHEMRKVQRLVRIDRLAIEPQRFTVPDGFRKVRSPVEEREAGAAAPGR